MRSSQAYWHVGAVVDEVLQVLEQAQGFVAAGDGGNALAILEDLTEAYVADWMELDDSNREASAFFEDLGAVWTGDSAACVGPVVHHVTLAGLSS